MIALPRMLPVRQNFEDQRLADVRGEVLRVMRDAALGAALKPGARIAIGVGSRGIANLAVIVRAVVDYWKSREFQPFIFPAMGSHGAATPEGQAEVLAHYGIDADSMGCPIISELDVVSLGTSPEGIEAFLDRNAFESDGVFLVNRVKWHTDFEGRIESGLFKMMAIGLGKFAGALKYHTYAYKMGLETVIVSAGRQVLASGKVVGGLAILEDANHNTAKVAALPVATMEEDEAQLLVLVKTWMGRIPFPLDVLVVDEIGKNFSGAGMDTKVVNRSVTGLYNPWNTAYRFERVYLRGMSPLSNGNAVGFGMADIVHDRILPLIDWTPTHINSLTSGNPAAIRTPIHFSNDRECLERLALIVGKFDTRQVTIGWIRNSLEISTLALSENLASEIARNPLLEALGPARELPFDGVGDLPQCGEFLADAAAVQAGY